MKKLLVIIPLILLTYSSFAQNDDSHAIVQVLMPTTVFGDFRIRMLYGNDKIEDFKSVKYSKDNREQVSNYVVDAMNYMKKKGYKFKQALVTMVETQYIFEKE